MRLVVSGLLLAVLARGADASPDPSCERTVAAWKRLHRALQLEALFGRDKPEREDLARINRRIDAKAKELLAACRKFGWAAPYRGCIAAGTKPAALERCFRDEYNRGDNRALCEPLLDHYMTLADADFATLYDDHDDDWIDNFRAQHRDSMRRWCIERGLIGIVGAGCVRAATTRAEFLACGDSR